MLGSFLQLKNGFRWPILGLGTWLITSSDTTKEAVLTALKNGYRCVDAAYLYQNEEGVGDAIKEAIESGIVRREDIFITTKIWNTFHSKQDVRTCLKRSLKALKLDKVDLLLMHWPWAFKPGDELIPKSPDGKTLLEDTDYLETYHAMEELVDEGLTRYIGVSNFAIEQLQRVLDNCRIRPVMLQTEISPRCRCDELVEFCQKNDIAVTAFSSLGNPGIPSKKGCLPLLEEPVVKKIAEKHGKTPAQVLLRHIVDRGICVIPKSVTPERIISNSKIFDFKLDAADEELLKQLKPQKIVLLEELSHHKYYPFHEQLQLEKNAASSS